MMQLEYDAGLWISRDDERGGGIVLTRPRSAAESRRRTLVTTTTAQLSVTSPLTSYTADVVS